MTFYDDMQNVASDLLSKFNQGVIQYKKITPGNGPADNPGPASEEVFTLSGAVARGVKFKYVQNGLALASDLQVTMSVDNRFTPEMNGFIIIDGTSYKVVQIIGKPEAGTPVVYVIIFRK